MKDFDFTDLLERDNKKKKTLRLLSTLMWLIMIILCFLWYDYKLVIIIISAIFASNLANSSTKI